MAATKKIETVEIKPIEMNTVEVTLVGDTPQTSTEERTSDSGRMTINYSGCYQDLIDILIANDYFVCCCANRGDEKRIETVTIKFWKE